MIAEAIRRAPTEHVIYFLLTSYLDGRIKSRRLLAADAAKWFPVNREAHVHQHLDTLRFALGADGAGRERPRFLVEALDVFTAARERLALLRARGLGSIRRCQATGSYGAPPRPAVDRPPPAGLHIRERVYGLGEASGTLPQLRASAARTAPVARKGGERPR